MGKVIFIDIDGTLLDYENKLPASADRAIKEARKMDIVFIFVQDVVKSKFMIIFGILV